MSALRDTNGKLDWAMLFEHFPLAFPELCRAREFGARHYTKDGKDGVINWKESINTPQHVVFEKGCIRGNISHSFKYLWGENRDSPQDDVHHLAFSALNALMALEYALSEAEDTPRLPTDDREPTYREMLKRGEEMPAWLIELIIKRHDVGELFPHCHVQEMFFFDGTPEGKDFWWSVDRWQCLEVGSLPKQPK